MANDNEIISEQRKRQAELRELKKLMLKGDVKPEPKRDEKPTTAKGKIENAWYHYKGIIIALPLVIALLTYIVVDLVTKPVYDYTVLVHGATAVQKTDIDEIEKYLVSVGTDIDGNGEVQVLIINTSFDLDSPDPRAGYGKNQKFNIEVMNNQAKIFIVDKKVFDMKNGEESLWTERFGLSLFDGKAEKFENTNLPPLKETKGEYYICYRTDENYDNENVKLFEKIIEK